MGQVTLRQDPLGICPGHHRAITEDTADTLIPCVTVRRSGIRDSVLIACLDRKKLCFPLMGKLKCRCRPCRSDPWADEEQEYTEVRTHNGTVYPERKSFAMKNVNRGVSGRDW